MLIAAFGTFKVFASFSRYSSRIIGSGVAETTSHDCFAILDFADARLGSASSSVKYLITKSTDSRNY
ncbi:MAG: hypothetical protein R2883_02570 [Caldisericia bacterium]